MGNLFQGLEKRLTERLDHQEYAIFQIFDDEAMKKQGISEENKRPLASALTVKELATKLGLDPERLAETIDTWNKHAKSGDDPEYGKKGSTVGPIKTPPFWGGEMRRQFSQSFGVNRPWP
jgi:hypothetical protein